MSTPISLCLGAAKTLEKSANSVSTGRLRVVDIARDVGLSPRQLARLANKGVPGVTRLADRCHFDWRDLPETRAWIRERKKFKKGNRKGKLKPKSRLSAVQLFARAVRKIERQGQDYLSSALSAASESQLQQFLLEAQRLKNFAQSILRGIPLALEMREYAAAEARLARRFGVRSDSQTAKRSTD